MCSLAESTTWYEDRQIARRYYGSRKMMDSREIN